MVAPLQASLAVGGVNDGEAVHSIVALPPAAPITGGVVSTIVTTWLTVAELLLQASVASQVLVILFFHPVTSLTSVSWLTVAPLQASLAVGGVNDGEAVRSEVGWVGEEWITGGVVSTMVMKWLSVAVCLLYACVESQLFVMLFVHPFSTFISVISL